ncbi:unnamed protein product [Enterobius vermicularis]|uniref:Xylulose kinase n=1 Tax=Enterobius vermicularis TaxID=51028 RepID=A0A0N4VIS2_ENTVE|nr:unnamed protein product [Enterobius vermicularis]
MSHSDNGVHKHEDGETITAPVCMWLEALDLVFQRLSKLVNLAAVRTISGCGQQHGTVYWNQKATSLLSNLNPSTSLRESLQDALATIHSPIWMDSSTTEECRLMEENVGGPMKLATLTGSRAFHRFSGSQIMKFYRKKREIFENTERISLVSSFIACVLCGAFADVDLGDACGMNLLDVRKGAWSRECLFACVQGNEDDYEALLKKLGTPVPCDTVVGKISPYFCQRYGLSSDCEVVAFTGDNLSSLAGLCLQAGQVAVSLGTSDTVLFVLDRYVPALEGHLFRNPVYQSGYMAFTRNRVRKEVGAKTWDDFEALVAETPPGNNGNIGFYFDDNEIIPTVRRGDYRFDSSKKQVATFSKEVEARAVLEHQSLAKRLHAEKLGNCFVEKGTMLVTGGASNNATIAQILADVFNCDVYTAESTDSAAIGGALRARHAAFYKGSDYFIVSEAAVIRQLVASPILGNVEVYNEMIKIYEELEKRVMADAVMDRLLANRKI